MLHFALALGRTLMSEQISGLALLHIKSGKPTAHNQLHKQNDTNLETQDIEDKMTKIVRSDTVVNPWAMADDILA